MKYYCEEKDLVMRQLDSGENGLSQAEAERREWAARLWDAVEGLDEPDRTLFLRYYYYGDKLKDIARALGLTAKQRLFRGRKALRDTLTKGGVEA